MTHKTVKLLYQHYYFGVGVQYIIMLPFLLIQHFSYYLALSREESSHGFRNQQQQPSLLSPSDIDYMHVSMP